MKKVRVVLISTYDLGRQPFGLASPAAWLRAAGHQVAVADLSCGPLPVGAVREADLAAFYLPMHTATRLALPAIERVRGINPRAELCAYGLYAPLNSETLREAGVSAVIGGEFESALLELAGRKKPRRTVSLERQQFLVPDRAGLPPLAAYARLIADGAAKMVGYTEATRGCKHLCRHCPVVPVYNGAFRVVQAEIVLEDIRRQVEAGAGHITFGDPDFFNGPAHGMRILEAAHSEWPDLTYDVTIKIEHLLKHRGLLPALRGAGCAFVTSAVESLDDAVLARLDKGHTRAEFEDAVTAMREAGLPLAPTFIPFTPWTTIESYLEFLRGLIRLGLERQTAPIQLAIRLLIPRGSRLLELPEIGEIVGPFDKDGLFYPWSNPDPAVEELCSAIQRTVHCETRRGDGGAESRMEVFRKIWDLAGAGPWQPAEPLADRCTIPYLTEPWYC